MNFKKIENSISKIVFLFISFVVIASGYVTQVLPCQTKKFLEDNIFGKHIIGILLCFIFIMLESGGWSFNMEEQNKAEVDWSNGNVIDTLIYGTGLYVMFLLSSKMQIIPNIVFYTLLFSLYLLNTQRNYWNNRKLITKEQNYKIKSSEIVLLFLSIISFFYGIIDYYIYKKQKHGKYFSLYKMILSKVYCTSSKKM